LTAAHFQAAWVVLDLVLVPLKLAAESSDRAVWCVVVVVGFGMRKVVAVLDIHFCWRDL